MLKTRIILVAVSIALVVLLFMLPKVVIENDAMVSGSPADSVGETIDMHVDAPADVVAAIKNLRGSYVPDSQNEKNAIFADSLANLYQSIGKFDSAAWFAEEAAKFYNNSTSWTKAGDYYYEAYSFALDKSRQANFASRAQSYYNKVLAVQPENYDVKTKLAMTYLTEANPMQAITMLRDVLTKDPTNQLALYNMAMLSIQSGQFGKAVERLEELIKLNPQHTQAHLLLGIAYMETGEKGKAREQLEKVKLLDKDPSVQATVDSYLKDLK